MKKKLTILLSFAFLFFTISCNNDSEETSITSHLKITLIDLPGDYESVNIDIKEIKVHSSGYYDEEEDVEHHDDEDNENEEGGWITLEGSDIGVVNILDYTDGHELTIYDSDFPAGYISQIRLVLNEKNTVVIDGDSIDMKTPSAQQSGLKLKVNKNLEAGLSYYLKLDFEASRSIVQTGNGKYILKPVIRVITENNGGSIKGEVLPEEDAVAIYVISGDDTLGSTYASAGSSAFLVSGIEAGSYTVSFEPDEGSALSPQTVEDVVVEDQKITDMGSIDLRLK
jgi:hypothetical protein